MSLRPRIERAPRGVVPERKREGMSRAHLDDVRMLPCVGCGYCVGKRDPHHLKRAVPYSDKGSTGRTSTDRYAIPACRTCHEAMHASGDDEAWLTERGVDGRSIAEALWRERGDPGRMLRIIARSLNGRGILCHA
jgi:hypothetical protein